jgi:hypothetical protein
MDVLCASPPACTVPSSFSNTCLDPSIEPPPACTVPSSFSNTCLDPSIEPPPACTGPYSFPNNRPDPSTEPQAWGTPALTHLSSGEVEMHVKDRSARTPHHTSIDARLQRCCNTTGSMSRGSHWRPSRKHPVSLLSAAYILPWSRDALLAQTAPCAIATPLEDVGGMRNVGVQPVLAATVLFITATNVANVANVACNFSPSQIQRAD